MKRQHFHQRVGFDANGSLVCSASGEFLGLVNGIHQPTKADVRVMLEKLREVLGISVAALAALLGVPRITARRWLNGSRSPSGAAKRLIWILYTSATAPETLADGQNWLSWKR
jgi:hypothetical protein